MEDKPNSVKWKPRGKTYEEAMDYIKGRRTGAITSLKTRWEKFNHAGIDGIEIHSTVIIGGRPGSLKSALKDQIIRDAFEYNPNLKFRVLDVQMEMVGRVTALRELSSATGKSYKYLCSAEGQINKEDYVKCEEYGKLKGDHSKYPVDVIEESYTVAEFANIVDEYMEAHKDENGNYVPTVIAIDHSILFLQASDESGLNDTLMNLGKMATAKKRKYPIIFIILSQLNRNVERDGRNDEKKYGNYIVGSDIFGGDGLLMSADIVIGIDRPALRNIQFFGPPGFIISGEDDLIMRWIKCRNGQDQLSFFKVDFKSMTIYETEPPPTVRVGGKEKHPSMISELKNQQTKLM